MNLVRRRYRLLPGVWVPRGERGRGALTSLVAAAVLTAGGCASTGAPRAPSLRLPQPVRDLHAERFGDQVDLRWTVPRLTTDREMLERRRGGGGPLMAEVCRVEGVGQCVGVERMPVAAGQLVAIRDVLPAGLLAGPARLVRYRVRVLNGQGRSADWSRDAGTVAGLAPPAMTGLTAATTDRGAQITWERKGTRPGEQVVLLEHTAAGGVSAGGEKTATLAVEAGTGADPGGTIDPSVHVGERARYTVYRSAPVTLEGRLFALNGEAASVTMTRQADTFAPAVPGGLLAVAVQLEGAKPEIDLSWEPNSEPDLAGYRVYRMDESGGAAALVRLTAEPVAEISYRDMAVSAGHRYVYRVTAVDRTGNESGKSVEAGEVLRP